MPTWATALTAIVVGAFGVWLAWWSKRQDERKADERKIEMAPVERKRWQSVIDRVRKLRSAARNDP